MIAGHDRVNILLVDDREENLTALSATLQSPGYHLVTARSGEDALREVLKHDFALILLDVQMPGMDGFETAELIRSRERSRAIPIIFVTAVSRDSNFILKGYSSGAVDYIPKPFDPFILRSKVAVFADLHRKNAQILRQAELIRLQERRAEALERDRVELVTSAKYQDLVEGIRNRIVWAADATSFRFTLVSGVAGRLLDYPVEFVHDLVCDEDRGLIMERLNKRASEVLEFDHRAVRRDGKTIWFQTGARFSEREDGSGRELRGLSIDITGLKEAEQEMRRAIRVRDEFLSIASHELKTPITPLKLQLQTLGRLALRKLPAADFYPLLERSLEKADRQINRLSGLIDELLDVSRISNGRLILHPENFDFVELVKEVTSRAALEFERANCELRLNLPDTLLGYWDRIRVEQVITNLITNALKFGGGHPIEIDLSGEGSTASFSIRDHGIGISEADQTRIFKRFERATPAANFGGLGLGLYFVGQILKTHGGQIQVESQLSQGSRFSFKVPSLKDASLGCAPTERAERAV